MGPPCFKAVDYAFSTTRPGVVYSFANSGGRSVQTAVAPILARSEDAGRTWEKWRAPSPRTPAGEGIIFSVIADMALDPFDENRVYVLLWELEAPSWEGSYRLLVTEDGGLSWRLLKEYIEGAYGPYIAKVFLDPHRAGTIYTGNVDILLRSRDGGETWEQYPYRLLDMAFHPRDPDVIYLSGRGLFYKSMDGGQTWFSLMEGNYWPPPAEITLDPEDPDHLFFLGSPLFCKVCESTEGGFFSSWKPLGQEWTPEEFLPDLPPGEFAGKYEPMSLALDPKDGRTLYVAVKYSGGGLLVTPDFGETWELLSPPQVWPGRVTPPAAWRGVQLARIAPSEPCTIFAASNGQDYLFFYDENYGTPDLYLNQLSHHSMSFDRGKTWTPPERCPSTTTCRWPQVCPWDDRAMVVFDHGVGAPGAWITKDGGQNWDRLLLERKECADWWCDTSTFGLAFNGEDCNTFLAARENIYATDDGGRTWRVVGDFFPPDSVGWIWGHPRFSNVIYCIATIDSAYDLYVSRDGGRNWQRFPTETAYYDAFIPDPQDPEAIYLLKRRPDGDSWYDTDVTFSLDFGATWERAPLERTIALEVSPSRHEELYALTMGELENELLLWRSHDRGRSWRQVHVFPWGRWELRGYTYLICDLSDTMSILESDANDPETVYVAMGPERVHNRILYQPAGVLCSRDGGLTWEDITGNLDPPQVVWVISKPSGEILASTNGAGIWRLTYRDDTPFLRGDANQDGRVNVDDPVRILDYLFLEGPTLTCLEAGNANGDDKLNLADAIYLLWFLHVQGPKPPAPYPACGIPAENQKLGCLTYRGCRR